MFAAELSEDKSSFTFMWNIKNFTALFNKSVITSPKFTSLDNAEWKLEIVPYVIGDICLMLKCVKNRPSTNFKVKLFSKKYDGSEVAKVFDVQKLEDLCVDIHRKDLIFEQANLFLSDEILTLGCHMEKISNKTGRTEQWNAFTEIPTRKCSIKCPVIFPLSASGMQQLMNFPSSTETKKYPDFKIVLDSFSNSTETLTIKIEMAKSSFPVYAMCKLSLKDVEGNVRYSNESKRMFDAHKDNETWDLKNFNFEQDQEHFSYSKNSIFTLNCSLVVSNLSLVTSRITETLICSSRDVQIAQKSSSYCPTMPTFKEKLECLYAERILCDFTIQVDNKEFKVHHTVLGTVSPVFCSMFERDMQEKKTSLLIIEDIDADTIERLINFAYSEIFPDLDWDSAVRLFSASDKYQILDLKQKCAEFLSSKLSIENATDALVIADMHQDAYLKKKSEYFICSNFKKIYKSEKWNILLENNSHLGVKLLNAICGQLIENTLQ